jgi:hypothetical protein
MLVPPKLVRHCLTFHAVVCAVKRGAGGHMPSKTLVPTPPPSGMTGPVSELIDHTLCIFAAVALITVNMFKNVFKFRVSYCLKYMGE